MQVKKGRQSNNPEKTRLTLLGIQRDGLESHDIAGQPILPLVYGGVRTLAELFQAQVAVHVGLSKLRKCGECCELRKTWQIVV